LVLTTPLVLTTSLVLIALVVVVPAVVFLLTDFGDWHPISTIAARKMIGMILRMVDKQ
jgi:hypothetical protein